ncbi:hypothetical protein SCA6_003071 [Theobroma cacao]
MAMNRNASTSLVYYGHRLRGSLYAPTVFKGAFRGSLLFYLPAVHVALCNPGGTNRVVLKTDGF